MDRLEALRVFKLVAERGNFSAAARTSGHSLATISRAIRNLEFVLGARLLHRTTRRMTLTPAGMAYLERIRDALETLDCAGDALTHEVADLSGRVVVTAPRLLVRMFLAAWMVEFAARHSALEVTLAVSDPTADLAQLGVDLTFRTGDLEDSSLIARPLGSYRRKLVASPDYVAARGRPQIPEDLTQHDCIVLTAQHPARSWRFESAMSPMTVHVQGRWTCDDNDVALLAALAGHGIARLPSWQVAQSLREGKLVELLADHPMPARVLQLVYTSRELLPRKVRVLIEYLTECYDKEHLVLEG